MWHSRKTFPFIGTGMFLPALKTQRSMLRRAACLQGEGSTGMALTKASHPYLGFTGSWNTSERNTQFQTGGKGCTQNYPPVGESLFFRDFERHYFNLGQINFVTLFLPLQYTKIICLGGYDSMIYLASSQILQLSAKGWVFPKIKY